MNKCIDCNCDISDRGNRAIRCDRCQRIYRLSVFNTDNKRKGTARRDKSTYQWKQELVNLTSDDLMQLVTIYKERIKYAKTDEETKELRTRIKIITVLYSKSQQTRGLPKLNLYGKNSICEDCRFYNKKQLRCTQHTEDEMDKAIETNVCNDYEYDSESKFRKEYYKQDVERNDELDDLGDYDYTQYEDGDE